MDPPYYNSDLGHYDGYTKEDFVALLEQLSNIEGKFLMSSYPSDVLDEYVERNGWISEKIEMHKSAGGGTKTEVLTMNYDLRTLRQQLELFG